MNHVAFPGLGLDFNINRVAFSVFGKDIYWYAIIIAVGFLLAAAYAIRRAPKFHIKEDNLLDALLCAVPAGIVCARLYYVIFNFDLYRSDPIRILYIWEGGLAIYGGIIGALIAVIIYCKVKKIKVMNMLDLGALGLLIGQCIGRWGNFVNGEAYGTATDLPWRMEIFDVESLSRIAVHPTFLYESLWNLLGFVLLHFRSKHRKFSGEIFFLYVAWYGLGRGFIEGLRTDSLYFMDTGLRVSQFLGFATCLIAVIYLFYQYVFKDHDELELTAQEQQSASVTAGIEHQGEILVEENAQEDADGDPSRLEQSDMTETQRSSNDDENDIENNKGKMEDTDDGSTDH